jgi:hypothetical protein
MQNLHKRYRIWLMALLATIGLVIGTFATVPAYAVGSYDNAAIADNGLLHLSTWGGQCKAFANNMVKAASSNTQNPSGYQSGWSAVGGVEVSSINATKGDIIQVTPAGSTDVTVESMYDLSVSSLKLHTAIIVNNEGNNSFTVVDSNWNDDEMVRQHSFNPYTWASGSIIKIWHLGTVSGNGTSLTDGTFFQNSGSPTVYEMVGGAALFVPSWASVGGVHSVTVITPTPFPSVPADGTFIQNYGYPTVYEMVGGAAIPVPSWASVGGSHPVVVIPPTVFPTVPANGTFFQNYGNPTVYTVAGGAAFSVPSWASIGGTHAFTVIPPTAMPRYPVDGTYVQEYADSTVYVVAGGAPVGVSSWSAVGGIHSVTPLPSGALGAQLRQYPADGTFVQGYGSPTVNVMVGGTALAVTSWSAVGGVHSVVTIDNNAFGSFRSYPTNGTYVRGYGSGQEFLSDGSTVSHVTTSPLPEATTVDDWSIVNQLGGTL